MPRSGGVPVSALVDGRIDPCIDDASCDRLYDLATADAGSSRFDVGTPAQAAAAPASDPARFNPAPRKSLLSDHQYSAVYSADHEFLGIDDASKPNLVGFQDPADLDRVPLDSVDDLRNLVAHQGLDAIIEVPNSMSAKNPYVSRDSSDNSALDGIIVGPDSNWTSARARLLLQQSKPQLRGCEKEPG